MYERVLTEEGVSPVCMIEYLEELFSPVCVGDEGSKVVSPFYVLRTKVREFIFCLREWCEEGYIVYVCGKIYKRVSPVCVCACSCDELHY